jgi:hypothetical protein
MNETNKRKTNSKIFQSKYRDHTSSIPNRQFVCSNPKCGYGKNDYKGRDETAAQITAIFTKSAILS